MATRATAAREEVARVNFNDSLVSEDDRSAFDGGRGGPATQAKGSDGTRQAVLGGACVLLLGAAAWAFFMRGADVVGEQAYFYDESAERVFTSATGQYPPIVGIDGSASADERDGVRAMVFTCCDTCLAKADGQPQIAYLQQFTIEAADLMAEADALAAQGLPAPPNAADRTWISANTLVRTLDDPQWHAKTSRRGQEITGRLHAKCPAGVFPRLADPSD